jgi:hypothetical protein
MAARIVAVPCGRLCHDGAALRALFFVMNTAEDAFAASQPLERTLLFTSEGTHERERLYRIARRTRAE